MTKKMLNRDLLIGILELYGYTCEIGVCDISMRVKHGNKQAILFIDGWVVYPYDGYTFGAAFLTNPGLAKMMLERAKDDGSIDPISLPPLADPRCDLEPSIMRLLDAIGKAFIEHDRAKERMERLVEKEKKLPKGMYI